MSQFKCAIIGVSGPRAGGHADAYRFVQRGGLVAVSSRQTDKLQTFADKYRVPSRYTDYREMFEKERPDLVHVNTPPTVRAQIIRDAEAAGVKALLIEKPIGLEAEDYLELRALSRSVRVRVAVNHQLHYHPNRVALQDRVARGDIGEVVLVDTSARLNLATQGTHMLQAIGAFHGRPVGTRATAVFGCASGTQGLALSSRAHYAPDEALIEITYPHGLRALLRTGAGAPEVRPGLKPSLHKRVSAYGTHGQVHWSMWGWSIIDRNGRVESEEHDYFEQDLRAQAALTESMFDWILNPGMAHPLGLEPALDDLEILLAGYLSVIERRPVMLPAQLPDGLIARLRAALAG